MSTNQDPPRPRTTPARVRSLEHLEEPLEAQLRELTAAWPAGDAAGSDVAEELRSFLEKVLEGPEGEMVSFSVGGSAPEGLMELHASLIAAIACQASDVCGAQLILIQKVSPSSEQLTTLAGAVSHVNEIFGFKGGDYLQLLQG